MLFIVFICLHNFGYLFYAASLVLKEKVSYLVATGSTICGASAIAITSRAIDAEPDEVSTSLISVFITALAGLFLILPLIASYFKISELNYGVFSGAVLQFTGFVKASVAHSSSLVKTTALSVKAVRYLGLLFVTPLFASFVKGKFYIPWFLWAFLASGLLFSFAPGLAQATKPLFKPILTVLWSIAMGAVGLNASLKALFTKDGFKALAASFISFIIAVGVFLIGLKLS